MTKLRETYEKAGQSIWLDYIKRSFVQSGELQALIDEGLRGITSNPSIFEEAIANSDDYDEALQGLVGAGKSVDEIYESLAIEDIQNAADLLRPVYDESQGSDGFVSLEVSPDLAYDTEKTIAEAQHLFKTVDRPNVMIKVPATSAGIPAIATLISQGINVNVTLMFSLKHYEDVSDAYLRGLERRLANGEDISGVASVASFFVSRVDTAVDEQLEKAGNRELQGKIGIANAKLAYVRYLSVFSSERFQRLAAHGARVQRVLYGSTSVKNPNYPDTLYVDNLMAANTVNTLPPATVDALRERGVIGSGLTQGLDEARDQLVQLAKAGVDLEAITQQLQDEGVIKFAKAFAGLRDSIAEKCKAMEKTPA